MRQKLVCRQKVRIEEEKRIAVREIFRKRRKQHVEKVITNHYNFFVFAKARLALVGRSPTTLCQWLGLTTIYVFVATAENLQPNQIAAFKRETLQLN